MTIMSMSDCMCWDGGCLKSHTMTYLHAKNIHHPIKGGIVLTLEGLKVVLSPSHWIKLDGCQILHDKLKSVHSLGVKFW